MNGQVVLCRGCNKALNVPLALIGKRISCTRCGTLMTVPTPEEEADYRQDMQKEERQAQEARLQEEHQREALRQALRETLQRQADERAAEQEVRDGLGERKQEPKRAEKERRWEQREVGPRIVDRQPMWMRPVSATVGRLVAPMMALVLGTLAFFKPSPKRSDADMLRVAQGFNKANVEDRLELQLGASRPLRNMRRIWRRKGLCVFGKLLGTLQWPVSEATKALFRMDCYDPFAHSIALYHRDTAILAHELGHAEDFASQKWRTLYIVARAFPVVLVIQEWKASSLGVGNLKDRGLVEEAKRANRVMGGGFGSYIGLVYPGQWAMIVAALIGQAVGALFKPFGKPAKAQTV